VFSDVFRVKEGVVGDVSTAIERGVLRFRQSLVGRGVNRASADWAANRYRTEQVAMTRLVDAAHRASDRLGRMRMVDRRRFGDLARLIYSYSRKVDEENWPTVMAIAAARCVAEGLDEESVLAALEACWRVLPHRSSDCRPAGVRELAEKLIREGVAMNSEEGSVKSEVRTDAAEPKRRRNAPGSDRVTAGTVKPTPLEQFSQKRALEQLRLALARFEPVVKKCVAFRLLKHESYKKLAKELDLSLDEVKEILAAVRPKVRAFTTYFDTDWHWVEGTKRTFVS
jgi:hypothetical protein